MPSGFGTTAKVVVYARVIDSHASVRAGQRQNYVLKDQGWAAIKIEIVEVTKGKIAERMTWISNVRVASWPWVRDFPENAFFYFALKRIPDLSKWCETDVYELVEMSPDTIRQVN